MFNLKFINATVLHLLDETALENQHLLKIIAGEMTADSGDLIIPKNIRIGYLEQHSGIDSSLTVWDEMMTVFEPLHAMERRLRSLEEQMADPDSLF